MSSAEGKRLASTRGSSEGKQFKAEPDLCTACDTGDHAESYCQECADYLCAECTKSHKRQRKTKQHTLMDVKLTKSMQAQNFNRCPSHCDDFIDKFCDKCNDVVCDVCVAEKHKDHKVRPISECAEKVFNLCLDRSKQLQGPFNKMKAAKKNVESKKKLFVDNCNSTEDEIKQRKDKLITMITEAADTEIDRVRSTKTKVESLCTQTVDQLERVLKDCETVATPLVMGTDVNNIVKRILFISSEINNANTTLSAVDKLEKIQNTTLGAEDSFSDIKGKAKKYISINDIDLPIFKETATVSPSKTVTVPSEISVPKKPVESVIIKSTKAGELPNKLQLLDTYKTDNPVYMSKHIAVDGFIAQYGARGPVNHFAYRTDVNELHSKSSYGQKPMFDNGYTILTINSDRHVIVSNDAIHLCDKSKVMRSEPHSDDGYAPDRLGYYDQQKFVTLCKGQKKLRYYDVNTLKILQTYSLNSSVYSCPKIRSYAVLCTSNGDILLETGDNEMTMFTHDGIMKAVVPIHEDYFKCNERTRCIDQCDKLLGVCKDDKSIHVFDLEGKHRILGKLDLTYIWGAGVGRDQNLYISYVSETNLNIIAKYKYL